MTQIQEIYTRLFVDVDAATSLLLKEDLIDAEFIRVENHRIFTKLNAVHDAATLRSSLPVSIQDAGLHFYHTHDVLVEPGSLGEKDDSNSNPQPPVAYVSDEFEDAPDESTPNSMNLPRTPWNAPTDRGIPYTQTLRVRSDSFHMSDVSTDEESEQLLTDEQLSLRREHRSTYKPGTNMAGPVVSNLRPNLRQSAGSVSSGYLRLGENGSYFPSLGNVVDLETEDNQVGCSIYPVADNLNHSYAGLPSVSDDTSVLLVSEPVSSTPPLAQDPQALQPRISHPSYPEHPFGGQSEWYTSPSSDQGACTEQRPHPGQHTHSMQDTHGREGAIAEQDTHCEQDLPSLQDAHGTYGAFPQPETATKPETAIQGQDMQHETLSASTSSQSAEWTKPRTNLRSNRKSTAADRQPEDSHEQSSGKATRPETGSSGPLKRKRNVPQTGVSRTIKKMTPLKHGRNTPTASSHLGELMRIASGIGSVDVRDELDKTYESLSNQACNHILRRAPRQSNLSTDLDTDPGQFLERLPLLRMRLESCFVCEQVLRTHKRIVVIEIFDAYTWAQNNPHAFLQLTATKVSGKGLRTVAPRKGRLDSIVKQRFVDVMFSDPVLDGHKPAVSDISNSVAEKHESKNEAKSAARKHDPRKKAKKHDPREKANIQVETWRRSGMRWSEMVRRFGYGILLLVPSELTDEVARTTTVDEWFKFLDLIETRRSVFEDLLLRATKIVEQFILGPASIPAAELSTLPTQLSLPRSIAVASESSSPDVSVPTQGQSALHPNLSQSNTTSLTDERVAQDSLEESLSQSCSQSPAETSISLPAGPRLPTTRILVDTDWSSLSLDPPLCSQTPRKQSAGHPDPAFNSLKANDLTIKSTVLNIDGSGSTQDSEHSTSAGCIRSSASIGPLETPGYFRDAFLHHEYPSDARYASEYDE